MVRRLPALRPDRYRVIAPRPRLAHGAGHAWEQVVLPARARGSLILSPANLAPLPAPRSAVVVHDVAPLRHPEAYSMAYVAFQRIVLPAIVRRAELVITVSEFSRAEICELLPVPPERTKVVPAGVAEQFHPDADAAAATAALGLTQPYVLSVATASARKGLDMLGPATTALRERGVELVVAGGGRAYMREAAGVHEAAEPRRLGYVAERHLPGLYAGALAVVIPSRYEGFGLPCLEAMASGVPVVATTAGALPEVCADAAILVAPGDGAALAEAVRALLAGELDRPNLINRGLARAAQLTWRNTAESVDRALAPLLAGDPGCLS